MPEPTGAGWPLCMVAVILGLLVVVLGDGGAASYCGGFLAAVGGLGFALGDG